MSESGAPVALRRRHRGAWAAPFLFVAATAAALLAPSARLDAAPPAVDARVIEGSLPRGQVLRRALRSDSRQAYFLYVPARTGPASPIFVTVHGISRNVEEHARLFAPYAEKQGVILVAPSFTSDRNSGYQRLVRDGPGQRADVALDAIIDEVAGLTGASGERFYLFGFSGGAQFAHRYTLAYPERIVRTVVGAAGWYTFPDGDVPYPYGLGASAERPDLAFEPERFLRVPITVLVGEADVAGGESLRRNEIVDRQQGTTRLERAHKWVAAMNRAAEERDLPPRVAIQQVPGIEHSFRQFMEEGGLGERVFAEMFGATSATGARR